MLCPMATLKCDEGMIFLFLFPRLDHVHDNDKSQSTSSKFPSFGNEAEPLTIGCVQTNWPCLEDVKYVFPPLEIYKLVP